MKKIRIILIISIISIIAFACGDYNSNENKTYLNYSNKVSQIEDNDHMIKCDSFYFDLSAKDFRHVDGEIIKKYDYSLSYFDEDFKVLILIEDEDNEFFIINVCSGKELLNMTFNYSDLTGVYQMDNRYFISVICDDCQGEEVWEFEIDLVRIEQVDLEVSELAKYKLDMLLPE